MAILTAFQSNLTKTLLRDLRVTHLSRDEQDAKEVLPELRSATKQVRSAASRLQPVVTITSTYSKEMNLKKHLTRLSVFPLILAFVACLTGCASTDMTGNRDATKVTMPSSGKAKVVFARFGSYGGSIGFRVHDGSRLIGVLGPNSFFTFECEPGRHQFSSTMEDVAMLDADLLPDRIYYAKVSAAMGMWIAQVNMYSLHPGCAGNLWPKLPKMLSSLRETAISPQLIAHDQTGAARYWERVQKYHELKYLPNASREQILPEHGQLEPVHR